MAAEVSSAPPPLIPPPALPIVTPSTPIRGRPRSSSISNGSPSPCPTALPSLLSLESPGASTSGASSSTHRLSSSLSIPRRAGHHRRTHSVSPPGFPSLSEHSPNGFAPSSDAEEGRRSSSPALFGLGMGSAPQGGIGGSAPIDIRRKSMGHLSPPNGGVASAPSSLPSRFYPSSSSSSSSSPEQNGGGLHHSHHHGHHRSHSHTPGTSSHHHHPHHNSSHQALLQGIRSHALPHTPTPSPAPSPTTIHHDSHSGFINPFSPQSSSSSPPPTPPPLHPLTSTTPTSPSNINTPVSPPFGPTPISSLLPNENEAVTSSTEVLPPPILSPQPSRLHPSPPLAPISSSSLEPLPGAFDSLSSSHRPATPPPHSTFPLDPALSVASSPPPSQTHYNPTTTSPASLYLASPPSPPANGPLPAPTCGGRISPPLLPLFGNSGMRLMPLSDFVIPPTLPPPSSSSLTQLLPQQPSLPLIPLQSPPLVGVASSPIPSFPTHSAFFSPPALSTYSPQPPSPPPTLTSTSSSTLEDVFFSSSSAPSNSSVVTSSSTNGPTEKEEEEARQSEVERMLLEAGGTEMDLSRVINSGLESRRKRAMRSESPEGVTSGLGLFRNSSPNGRERIPIVGSTGGEDQPRGRREREQSVSPPPVTSSATFIGGTQSSDEDGMEVDVIVVDDGDDQRGEIVVDDDNDGGDQRMGSRRGEGEEDEEVVIAEDSLSPLERIFVCAKSEVGKDRARVAHHLADWLNEVDISEAVEYALPLLAGLATDPEEIVKEVFAPQLDRIMWHFFTQCPLLEIASPTSSPPTANSPVGSPVPSRYLTSTVAPPHLSPTNSSSSEPITTGEATDDTTPKTSPSNTETPDDPPKISVTTFTSLLGALLTDQSTNVAGLTQTTLVRFLCRLKGDWPHDDEIKTEEEKVGQEDKVGYSLNEEARSLLEDEFINGIVIGLARLDDDDEEDEEEEEDANGEMRLGRRRRRSSSCSITESESHSSSGSDIDSTSRGLRLSRTPTKSLPPPLPREEDLDDELEVDMSASGTLVMSPEEELIEDGGWLNPSMNGDTPGPTSESWGEPLISYFNDGGNGVEGHLMGGLIGGIGVSTSSTSTTDYGRLLPRHHSSSSISSPPNNQVYSSFSPDVGGQGDEEAAVGKLVSMSLISAIAQTDCLAVETLEEMLLPEVVKMKNEPMFYVRKEAVQALTSLSRRLPLEAFEKSVLPLHATFASDTLWHVRRAACLALPTICKRLSPEVLRSQVVSNIRLFSDDSSRIVRSAALEVCGELIYLFFGDPAGVPEELLAFFLGQSIASPPPPPPSSNPPPLQSALDDDTFTPLQTALDSPPLTFFDSSAWAPSRLFKVSRDPDRPVMCAFNLPAVALTLGREKWHLIKEYYMTLCSEKADKVRQSLASSMHEIAKIIGPDQADSDLVEPLGIFLRDYDFIQGAMLENISSLLCSFGPEGGREALLAVSDAWSAIKNWRRREVLAKELGALTAHFIVGEGPEEVLLVLAKAFKDPVAAVRDEAVYAIPTILRATEADISGRNKLSAFLSVFGEDSSYRNRVTYTNCALATVRSGVGREVFESYFLHALGRLARDKVVNVRLGVAKVIAEACRSSQIYAEPSTRTTILDILSNLSQNPDRDVLALISEFYSPSPNTTPAPGSPSPTGLDRSGAQSRMEMYESASKEGDGESTPLPIAQRSNPDLHGFAEDEMSEIALDPPTPPTAVAEEEEASDVSPDGDGDVEMDDDDLLDSPASGNARGCGEDYSPVMVPSALSWRELEDEDAEFLEVASHR